MILAVAVVFMTAGTAFAGVALSVPPNYPSHVEVGEVVPVSLAITNGSFDTEATHSLTVTQIFHIPSCQTGSPSGVCLGGAVDPGVFLASATGTGRAGSACGGITFTIAEVDVVNGEVQFTPSAPVVLAPVSPPGGNITCVIDFTVTVLKLPTKDASLATPGLQTVQHGRADAQSNDDPLLTGGGSGTDSTTVNLHCLHVVKNCTNASCINPNIGVSVTATNCGTEGLTTLLVTDDHAGALTCVSTTLAPGASTTCTGSYTNVPGSYTDTITASAVSAVSQDTVLPDATSVLSKTCSIPSPALVHATKSCNDNVACNDASASFAVTIYNDGDVAWSGTWSDANCNIANQAISLAAHTNSGPLPCESSTKNGGGTAFINSGGSVSVTSVVDATCTASATIPAAQCPITPCPCSVIIEKTVAPDIDCNGVADSAFGENVTVDAGVCVVYQICVTNTGQQVLDSNGVKVKDDKLGVVDLDFGEILVGAPAVCKTVANPYPAAQCKGTDPQNPDVHTCICADVKGTNTAEITSAICQTTNDSACNTILHPGSICTDTANVACTTPMACRMTGGQNYFTGSQTDTVLPSGLNYTLGGQIGAPTDAGCRAYPQKGKCVSGLCTGGLNGGLPCTDNTGCPNDAGKGSTTGPWGDWEHNHHSGPDDSGSVTGGSFAFHSGTAAAPDLAYIHSIICADEGWCVQARPAPNKQIYWDGTGVFHNIKGKKGENLPLAVFGACPAQPVPWSNKTGGTIVYYKAHVGDFGEPAGTKQNPADNCSWVDGTAELGDLGTADNCQLVGDVNLLNGDTDAKFTALHPLCLAQDCKDTTGGGCPDWYEIEIHCTADPASPIAYSVAHFITDGNFQLHPSVGSSCQPCGDGICDSTFDEDCFSCPADCGSPVNGVCP